MQLCYIMVLQDWSGFIYVMLKEIRWYNVFVCECLTLRRWQKVSAPQVTPNCEESRSKARVCWHPSTAQTDTRHQNPKQPHFILDLILLAQFCDTVPHMHQISAVSPSWDIGNAVLALMLAWRQNAKESITNRPLGCDSQQFCPGIVFAFVLSYEVSGCATFIMSDTGFKHLTLTSPANHTF